MTDKTKNDFTRKRLKAVLRQNLRPHRGRALVAIIFYCMKHTPAWVMPIFIGTMAGMVADPPEKPLLWGGIYAAIMLGLVIQNIPSHTMYVRSISTISRDVAARLRMQVCQQLQRLSLLYHERTGTGRLQTKLIRDIEFLETFPKNLVEQLFGGAGMIVVALSWVAFQAPETLPLFMLMLPAAWGIRRLFRQPVRKRAHELRTSYEQMSGKLTEMINMVPVTRAHGLEETALREASDRIDHVSKRGVTFDIMAAIFNSSGWVVFTIFQIVFLLATVYLGFIGRLDVADVVTFNSYFAMMAGSINVLLSLLPQMSQASESFASVCEVIYAPDLERNEGKQPVDLVQGHLALQHVTYCYAGSQIPAVKQVSFEALPDQTLAIIGPSGGGKSTTLGLLLGFLRPTEGQVFYDGVNGNELDLRTYRRQMSVVTQDSLLFSGSVRDNVAYGMADVTDEQIIRALDHANAWEFVSQLPDGMHTRLGESGMKLSGGQMQRIAIARAMLRNPKVLILDEPTSALDIDSAIQVQQTIANVKQGRTTILVTHSIALAEKADRIAIMEDGKLTAFGSPEELKQGDNFFSRSWQKRAQAS